MPKVIMKLSAPENYVPVYVNGALGGINVKGELVINFFSELNELPAIQEYELIDGMLSEIQSSDSRKENLIVKRVIQTGIVINYQTALDIQKWLSDNIELFEGFKK